MEKEILTVSISMKTVFLVLSLIIYAPAIFAQEQKDTLTNSCCPKTAFAESENGHPASFLGAASAYSRWLQKKLETVQKTTGEITLKGKCDFSFVIDTSGVLTRLQFCSMKGSLAETIIREIFSNSPLWIPAVSETRGKVEQKFCQRITFNWGDSD